MLSKVLENRFLNDCQTISREFWVLYFVALERHKAHNTQYSLFNRPVEMKKKSEETGFEELVGG